MTFADGFWFAVGKGTAEFLMATSVFFGIFVVYALAVFFFEFRKK